MFKTKKKDIPPFCNTNNVEGFFAPRGLYAIMDTVAKELSSPFYAKTDEQALRMYESEIAKASKTVKEQSQKLGYDIPFNRDDWKLFRLGTIDIETGCIVALLQDLERF